MLIDFVKKYILVNLDWSALRWLLVGFSTFLIDYFIFVNLYTRLPLMVANFVSTSVAVAYNFSLHKYWTFDNSMPHMSAMTRYAIAMLFNYLVNTGVVKMAFIFGLVPFVGKFLAAGISAPTNFFILRLFVFKRKCSAEQKTTTYEQPEFYRDDNSRIVSDRKEVHQG